MSHALAQRRQEAPSVDCHVRPVRYWPLTCHSSGGEVSRALQPVLGAAAAPGQDRRAALRRGARADRQRRSARLRRLRGHRALLLPEVLRSPPTRRRSSRPPRSARSDIRFRTMLHALPYHNPTVLASVIAHHATSSRAAATSGASAAATAGSPSKAGVPLDEHARPRYEEAVDLLLDGARQRALLAPRRVLRRRRLARRPVRRHASSASTWAAPPTARTRSPPSAAGASPCRRSCPTRCSSSSSTSTARAAPSTARAGHRLDPRLPPRRGPRDRDARGPRLDHGLHPGQLLAADRVREAADGRADQRPATASTPPGSWSSSPRCPTSS